MWLIPDTRLSRGVEEFDSRSLDLPRADATWARMTGLAVDGVRCSLQRGLAVPAFPRSFQFFSFALGLCLEMHLACGFAFFGG